MSRGLPNIVLKVIAMALPAPDWISFEADKTEGLDLLGLRAPVQRIGNDLFNGVTTVTPKVRYLSVFAWIVGAIPKRACPIAGGHSFRLRRLFGSSLGPQVRYWIVALQSSWRPVERIVFAYPVPVPATLLIEFARGG